MSTGRRRLSMTACRTGRCRIRASLSRAPASGPAVASAAHMLHPLALRGAHGAVGAWDTGQVKDGGRESARGAGPLGWDRCGTPTLTCAVNHGLRQSRGSGTGMRDRC